jgi:hypothetical protein
MRSIAWFSALVVLVLTQSATFATTTTSTTLPLDGCSIDGCRLSTVPLQGRLKIVDKPFRIDRIVWKWRKGSATTVADLGDPLTTTGYELCMSHGIGIRLGVFPSGASWTTTANGYAFHNEDTPNPDRVLLRSGADGYAAITVKIQGLLGGQFLPLPLPIFVRLRASNGECWADTFYESGASENTAWKFKGKPGSPGGAFVD